MGRLFGLTLLLLVAAVYGYFRFYPDLTQTEQARYRLTAVIETPSGSKVGTGVWGYSKAATFDVPVFSFEWHFAGRVEGEAIPIDLEDGRTLYMVLGGRNPASPGWGPARFSNGLLNLMPLYPLMKRDSFTSFGASRSEANAEIGWIRSKTGQSISLDCSPRSASEGGECPALVLADRSGARISLLDHDDLAATLGPGYSLQGVTLKVVEDPITRGIQSRLPWVKPSRNLFYGTAEEELKATGFSRHDPANWRYPN